MCWSLLLLEETALRRVGGLGQADTPKPISHGEVVLLGASPALFVCQATCRLLARAEKKFKTSSGGSESLLKLRTVSKRRALETGLGVSPGPAAAPHCSLVASLMRPSKVHT